MWLRRTLGWFVGIVGWVLGCGKQIADWIGRSTLSEDADSLWQKAAPMIGWIQRQPDLWFYGSSFLIVVTGMALVFYPQIQALIKRRTGHLRVEHQIIIDDRKVREQRSFELWEAACLIGGQPFQRPPPPGEAFLAMERMRRAFDAGELMLMLPKGEREFLRAARKIQRMSLTKLDPPLRELDDRTKISRDELVSYVRKLGISVPGLTND